jgi:molybdenum cofactor cytidylyltransferase
MANRSSQAVVCACVLAAGTSTRFGETKLVQHLRGKPLVQRALLAAQGACAGLVTLVVGHDKEAVTAASAGLSDNVIVNCDYELGIGTSISAGVRACRKDADAILIILADQPLVTAAHLNELIDTWSGAKTEIVASWFEGIVIPPILFPKSAFDALCDLTGDTGAKKILLDDQFDVRNVEFQPASLDVDTPGDLQNLDQD